MRRSAAPSFKAGIKRTRYLPWERDTHSQNSAQNKHFKSHINNLNDSQGFNSLEVFSHMQKTEDKTDAIRSNNDILDLLEVDTDLNSVNQSIKETNKEISSYSIINNSIPVANQETLKSKIDNLEQISENQFSDKNKSSSCLVCLEDIADALLYNVLYCKRSSKKHKIWEGDGLLVVKNRSAVLKDLTGKMLDRGLGYKLKEIESLEEGSKFFVGSKECEVQHQIPPEEYENVKYCKCGPKQEFLIKQPVKVQNNIFKTKFSAPVPLNLPCPTKYTNESLHPSFNEVFILPAPTKDYENVYHKGDHSISDVYIDSFIVKQLRSHQKEGVSFMYKCIMGFQHEYGQGVILADEMGLGKTLQCIALIWTLLNRGPYGGLPVLSKVLIITPSSLVINWQNEFHKWLGKTRLSVFAVTQKNSIQDYMKNPKPVFIISYEMFSRSSELLSAIPFDLVICDEGHRIKNLNVKISSVVNCLSTNRRILLTGTPIQNDLAEFFSLIDFVNPGALGTLQYFRKTFEKPIIHSRNQECSEAEKEYGEERSNELGEMTKLIMLRRTQEVINQYLPPKTEKVIFCRPSELQKKIYKHLLKSRAVVAILSSASCTDLSTPLVYISVLRKLCNHPFLLYKTEKIEDDSANVSMFDYIKSIFPPNYKNSPADSGKMKVLENMLTAIFSNKCKEKVVIVSAFTKTLDILEYFCKLKYYEYLRLDGSTNTSLRQSIVDVFNHSYTKYNVFLLSSKAGGVGFNLVGASRIILYDIDWNPANDLQAMSRIWRDGQKQEVYVYRLLTTGTIEEKMFQRQLSKQSLSGSVLDSSSLGKLRFSREELMDLFTFFDDSRCVTHDLINCKCLNFECILNLEESKDDGILSEPTLHIKNIGMAELMNWTHICGPISSENCSDPCLVTGGNNITFLFQNTVNAKKTCE